MPRKPGVRNRNYPSVSLRDCLAVPETIEQQASGKLVKRYVLAELLGTTVGSSSFKDLLLASRAFGLTNEGVNQDSFSLTDLGRRSVASDYIVRLGAAREAVLKIVPFKAFLEEYANRKVPAPAAFKSWLIEHASVPTEWADECMQRLLEDAQLANFIRETKGGKHVDLDELEDSDFEVRDDEFEVGESDDSVDVHLPEPPPLPSKTKGPKKVFIGHGKTKQPVDQLKEILQTMGVPHVVAIDEANAGMPISEKVAALMKEECSAAIFILSADERFFREDAGGNMVEVWRPSENAVYELGAASVLYGRRIILYKEDKVVLPTDYRDLGHIRFSNGDIDNTMMQLFKELQALRMVELRVAD